MSFSEIENRIKQAAQQYYTDGSSQISDEEFEKACKSNFRFKNKFEYALFKLYCKNFEFKQVPQGGCVHCGSSMGNNKINCSTCATLQIDGRELVFSGDDR